MPRKKKPIKDDPQSELFEVSAEVESSSYSKASDDDLFAIKTDAGHVDDMFSDWFLDYASYVILERAVL